MRSLTLILVILMAGIAWGQDDKEVPENVIENQKCLKCHGDHFYTYYNEWTEADVKERMNPYFVIDSAEFYNSNHDGFVCIDCHSYEYEEFPHAGYLRMELKYTCLDCHGGDENYAMYNFEKIQEEFEKSVHSSRHDETFTCWMCHDPHTYAINARTNLNVKDIVTYDNEICLSCHADIDKYQLLTEARNPNILETHDWLPNQALHFKNVRCIDCHARTSDTLLVAHEIKPKEEAVKRCVECHSENSILMASLYKHQAQEKRNKAGFFNASILNEAYVIGANRNFYLNWISVVLFGVVFIGIFAHAVLRILKK
ncbi:MAG: cytochrome c3 family protein [Bacteroidota bacterium]|nr:cytochrome c3 family protein [Bacteroidota bacterium]